MTNFHKNTYNPADISDSRVYELCRHFGKTALRARNRFLGLLPEVQKRGIYKQKGCASVFEFAAKLAGVSRLQVENVLRLSRQFENKPLLMRVLTQGEVSMHKLLRIANIATTKNQNELVTLAKKLSKAALESYVKDYQLAYSEKCINSCYSAKTDTHNSALVRDNHGLLQQQTFIADYSCPGKSNSAHYFTEVNDHANGDSKRLIECEEPENSTDSPKIQLSAININNSSIDINSRLKLLAELNDSTIRALLDLNDMGHDINDFIQDALNKRESQIQAEKELLAAKINAQTLNPESNNASNQSSRHVPAKVRRLLLRQYGTKCAVPNCDKPSVEVHHTLPYSMARSHNPLCLAPLCHAHHELAHSINSKTLAYACRDD